MSCFQRPRTPEEKLRKDILAQLDLVSNNLRDEEASRKLESMKAEYEEMTGRKCKIDPYILIRDDISERRPRQDILVITTEEHKEVQAKKLEFGRKRYLNELSQLLEKPIVNRT